MLLSFAVAVAAPAQAQTAATPVTATAPAAPTERKVCRLEQVTGSMMPPRRICMTQSEYHAWQARMQGNVNAFRDRPQRAAGLDTQ